MAGDNGSIITSVHINVCMLTCDDGANTLLFLLGRLIVSCVAILKPWILLKKQKGQRQEAKDAGSF